MAQMLQNQGGQAPPAMHGRPSGQVDESILMQIQQAIQFLASFGIGVAPTAGSQAMGTRETSADTQAMMT